MCRYAEWEGLVRRVEETVDEGHMRDLASHAAARIDALIDEIMSRACAPEDVEWVRSRERRSRTEWVV